MKGALMTNVILTIDTEVTLARARTVGLASAIEQDIYGVAGGGEFGFRFQSRLLTSHGLKAVFFVEPFFSFEAGLHVLRRIVREILADGHEVGAHPHLEWLPEKGQGLSRGSTWLLTEHGENEQSCFVQAALEQLRAAGAPPIASFRAADFAANLDTLRALRGCGISFDSSHNPAYRGRAILSDCPDHPALIEGVCEFPITRFACFDGTYRPMQICACSTREFESVLIQAWRAQWHSVVIVSHSFELLKRRNLWKRACRKPCSIVIRRFEKLCRFLAANRDKFRTVTFSQMDVASIPVSPRPPLSAGAVSTAVRMAEQLLKTAF